MGWLRFFIPGGVQNDILNVALSKAKRLSRKIDMHRCVIKAILLASLFDATIKLLFQVQYHGLHGHHPNTIINVFGQCTCLA